MLAEIWEREGGGDIREQATERRQGFGGEGKKKERKKDEKIGG